MSSPMSIPPISVCDSGLGRPIMYARKGASPNTSPLLKYSCLFVCLFVRPPHPNKQTNTHVKYSTKTPNFYFKNLFALPSKNENKKKMEIKTQDKK